MAEVMEKEAAAVVESKPSPFRFREHYPAKESRHLFKMFGQMDLDDVMTVVPLAVKMVESWDLEGDPSKPESYDDLNIFTMLNLYRDITTFWNTHLKN